jgi:hypothetical protein
MSPRGPGAPASSALLAAGTLALVAVIGPAADAGSISPGKGSNAPADVASLHSQGTSGLLTGRLSAEQRACWQAIVSLVVAEDDGSRPLHPTLRRMWDEVAASGHEVHVELAEPCLSQRNVAGFFEIESVLPDGRIVARVQLDLETIDRAAVGDPAHHGFARFHGLTRAGRHAEVLGHELATPSGPSRIRRAPGGSWPISVSWRRSSEPS